jgi:ABC-type transporter Mla subunit MlaD
MCGITGLSNLQKIRHTTDNYDDYMQQMISKTKTYYARVALSYGAVKKGSTTSAAYPPSFYMHLKDHSCPLGDG